MKRITTRYIVAAGIIVVLMSMALIVNLRGGLDDTLAGSTWHLTSLNGRVPQVGAEPIRLSFQEERRAGGNAGCNSYGGEYVASGGALTVSGVISTMMACADDRLNAQESEYLQALESVAAYERAGDQLTLKDAGGTVLLVFTAA